MSAKIAFVHTVASLVGYFDNLSKQLLPGLERIHTLDEPLLQCIIRRGRLAPADTHRLAGHVEASAESGAGLVLVTCSTISPCVDEARREARIPVLKIDEAMIEEAARKGGRIAVLATHSATLGPTREGLMAAAERLGRTIRIEEGVVSGAIEARQAGDTERHDAVIAEEAAERALHCDVVVLAQASMAPALSRIPDEFRDRVLTSPSTALARAGAHFA